MADSQNEPDAGVLVQQLIDRRTRRDARRKLVALGAVQPLLECLRSENESVVWSAVESLGELQAGEAVEPLVELLAQGVLVGETADALARITGRDFGPDVDKWRVWIADPHADPAGHPPEGQTERPMEEPADRAQEEPVVRPHPPQPEPKERPQEDEHPVELDVAQCVRRAAEYLGVDPAGAERSFRFTLGMNEGRSQKVNVYFGREDSKGEEIVVIYSECGPAQPRFYETLLRKNMGLPAGAFAIRDVDGKPHFVMVDAMPAATVTPRALAKRVQEIAELADSVEKALAQEDAR